MPGLDQHDSGGRSPARSLLEAAERSKISEDALTEIFATMLQQLPEFGDGFWRFLAKVHERPGGLGEPEALEVLTQVRPDETNRPDMQLRSGRVLVWIENKLFSPEGYEQMPRYAALLEGLKKDGQVDDSSELFTLRTYRDTSSQKWHGINWLDIHRVANDVGERLGGRDWREESEASLRTPAELRYLADFLAALERRGLTMKPITHESIRTVSKAQTAIGELRTLVGAAADYATERGWQRIEFQPKMGVGTRDPLGQVWNHLSLPAQATLASPTEAVGEVIVSPKPDWIDPSDWSGEVEVFGGLTFDPSHDHVEQALAGVPASRGANLVSRRSRGVWRLGRSRTLGEAIGIEEDSLAGQGERLGEWLVESLEESPGVAQCHL